MGNKKILAAIAASGLFFGYAGAREALTGMTVEMMSCPEGVWQKSPRFSWQIESDSKDVMQSAYRIEVASSRERLENGNADVWDSGKVLSSQSHLVSFQGADLQGGEDYFWRVTVWPGKGKAIKSDTQYWSMALDGDQYWEADWIGLGGDFSTDEGGDRTILPARYLRKDFELRDTPVRAVWYVSGIGSSTNYVNGLRVSEDIFGPHPTWYDESVSYLTYDVSPLLKKGVNAIGVKLGNGRYMGMRARSMATFGLPRLKGRLEVEYADGSRQTVVTDASWRATDEGPIRANNEFDGEIYDAGMELGDWTTPGYYDGDWSRALIMDSPKGRLVAQRSPSLGVMEEISPLSVRKVGEGRYIVDMGQNMTGVEHVRLYGRKGSPVKIRFAEVLNESGDGLYVDNLRSAKVEDVYIPAGDGEFEWTPEFVYHGFRFMEITGVEREPELSDIRGKIIYDRMATAGSFECSDTTLNRLHANAFRGIRGNYRGMPTDCPQRDERLGWLGDRTMGAYGESFLMGNALLYKKWLADIEESMSPEGSISVVSPRYWTIYHDDVTWPAAYFYVADMLLRQFGDDSAIRERYASMKKWVEHMVSTKMGEDYIMAPDEYGDWCVPPEELHMIHSQDPARVTDKRLLSTSYFHSILKLMEKFATINGADDDALRYAGIADRMREAYNRRFFNPSGYYDNNTVTANLVSLGLGLVPEGEEDNVFGHVSGKIEADGCHTSVGVIGAQHQMRELTANGRLDLAYTLASSVTYPSWGYMIERGATTIWELWNGDTADPAMNSRNHVMLLGDLLIWMYEDLAGISCAPDAPGFRKIHMQPNFPDGLDYVKASHVTPYGEVRSHWRRIGEDMEWEVTVPANTEATLVLPSGWKLKKGAGVHSVSSTSDRTTAEIGSGTYLLTTR